MTGDSRKTTTRKAKRRSNDERPQGSETEATIHRPAKPRRETRDAYDRKRVSVHFTDDSLTKQSFKDEVNINNILARFRATGQMPTVSSARARYDFNTAQSYLDAQNLVASAKTLFEEQPAAVREEFRNDVLVFLDAIQDEKSTERLVELGILSPDGPEVIEPLSGSEAPSEAPELPQEVEAGAE